MTRSNAPKFVAALSAVFTTLVLFSAVTSLADEDKAMLAAARTVATAVAALDIAPARR